MLLLCSLLYTPPCARCSLTTWESWWRAGTGTPSPSTSWPSGRWWPWPRCGRRVSTTTPGTPASDSSPRPSWRSPSTRTLTRWPGGRWSRWWWLPQSEMSSSAETLSPSHFPWLQNNNLKHPLKFEYPVKLFFLQSVTKQSICKFASIINGLLLICKININKCRYLWR